MPIISPSLLAADFLNLKDEIERLNKLDELWIHLDIMDGHFVPNLTFGPVVIKNLSNITKHKLDAHLMVKNPEQYIAPLKEMNIHNFTFHWEAVTHHDRLIQELKSNFSSVGVSLNPSTPVHVIPLYLLEKIDLVLVMSVNPGFGGQSFIDATVQKIKDLNKIKIDNGFTFQIQVDGGIKDNNSKELCKAGANNLVAGSFIFAEKDKNYKLQIEKLK